MTLHFFLESYNIDTNVHKHTQVLSHLKTITYKSYLYEHYQKNSHRI